MTQRYDGFDPSTWGPQPPRRPESRRSPLVTLVAVLAALVVVTAVAVAVVLVGRRSAPAASSASAPATVYVAPPTGRSTGFPSTAPTSATPVAATSSPPRVPQPKRVDSDPPYSNALVKTAPQQIRAESAGSSDFTAVQVTTCIVGLPGGVPSAWLAQTPWSVARQDGSTAGPVSQTFPDAAPAYPRSAADGQYQPGQCVTGWIVFPATSSPIAAVHYRDTLDGSDRGWAVHY